MDEDLKQAMVDLHNAYGDGLRESLNIPANWRFIDSPKIAKEDFITLHEAVGDAEVRFVVMSEGPYSDAPDKTWTRYTAFYSPLAIERIRQWSVDKLKEV